MCNLFYKNKNNFSPLFVFKAVLAHPLYQTCAELNFKSQNEMRESKHQKTEEHTPAL